MRRPHPKHKHRCNAGEGSGGDGPVPGRTIRQEPDICSGVDDGGREADEGGVAGLGNGEIISVERKPGREITELNNRDDEGHSETDAPDGHGPVTYDSSPDAHVGQQGEGHAGGAELRQVAEAAHLAPFILFWGCRPGGHGVVKSGRSQSPVWPWSSLMTHQRKI